MERALKSLNAMPTSRAAANLLRCCGSQSWASNLADRRPFESVADLIERAYELWWALDEEDWLEAFSSHPEIGGSPATSTHTRAAHWAVDEQAGAQDIEAGLKHRLFEANMTYRARFGFIFIICATGKNADEMLHDLESRLANDRQTEIRIAAGQQMQITEIRLKKMLDEMEQSG